MSTKITQHPGSAKLTFWDESEGRQLETWLYLQESGDLVLERCYRMRQSTNILCAQARLDRYRLQGIWAAYMPKTDETTPLGMFERLLDILQYGKEAADRWDAELKEAKEKAIREIWRELQQALRGVMYDEARKYADKVHSEFLQLEEELKKLEFTP